MSEPTEDELVEAWKVERANLDFIPTHYVLINERVYADAKSEEHAFEIANSVVASSDQAIYEGQKSPVKSLSVVKIIRSWMPNDGGELV